MGMQCRACGLIWSPESLNGSVVIVKQARDGLRSWETPAVYCPNALKDVAIAYASGAFSRIPAGHHAPVGLESETSLTRSDYYIVKFRGPEERLNAPFFNARQLGLLYLKSSTNPDPRSFLSPGPPGSPLIETIDRADLNCNDLVAKVFPEIDPAELPKPLPAAPTPTIECDLCRQQRPAGGRCPNCGAFPRSTAIVLSILGALFGIPTVLLIANGIRTGNGGLLGVAALCAILGAPSVLLAIFALHTRSKAGRRIGTAQSSS
jgi:hypothetical protein